MRLIDADELKQNLSSLVVGGEKAIEKTTYENSWIYGIHTAYREINEAPTIEIPQWIPCSERLPKERGYYLVTTDGSHNYVIDIAEYDFDWRGGDFILEWHKASKILAWMPLPERYKEEAFRKYNGLKEGERE